MNYVRVILSIACVVIPLVAKEPKSIDIDGVGYISIGGSYFDLESVNSAIEPDGYKGLSNSVVQVSLGGEVRYGRLITDNAVTGHWWSRGENSFYRTRLWGLDFMTAIGYDFVEKEQTSFYPFAGLGVGGLWLKLGHREVLFDEIVNGNVQEDQTFSQMTLDVHTGIGFDVKAIGEDHISQFGIKAGYRFDVSDSKRWYRDNSSVSGAPSLKASGPFLKIVFGFADNS